MSDDGSALQRLFRALPPFPQYGRLVTWEEAMRALGFDPDLSPEHETNKEAAKANGLRYDSRRKMYVDEDGCLRRDRFGQPL